MVVLFSLTFRKFFSQVSTLAKQQINKYVEDLVPGLKGRYVYFLFYVIIVIYNEKGTGPLKYTTS